MSKFHVRDQRDPGWAWFDNEIIDVYARRICADGKPLGVGGVAVYAMLARFAGTRGHCHLSLSRIADTLGISRPTVIKYLGKLEEMGLIAKVTHMVEGKAEQECNEYIMLKIKPDGQGGKDTLPGSKKFLPPGQRDLPPGQRDLPPGQGGLLPDQIVLPRVVNDVDGGGQAALPKEELPEKETRRTQRERTVTVNTTAAEAIPGAPPLNDSSMGKRGTRTQAEVEASEVAEDAAPLPAPKALKEADGTLRYPYLAEVCDWFHKRFGRELLPAGKRTSPAELAAAEAGLGQLAVLATTRGEMLLGTLDNRCWLNLKKHQRLQGAAQPLAELTAQVTYALEDLGGTTPAAAVESTPPPSPLAKPWQAPGMSEEERRWREKELEEEKRRKGEEEE
ncbi:MAG: helix-turn-helix domain-containing protein [Armatimonadota bacterium]